MAAPVKVARQQTTPVSGTFRTLAPEPTPTRTLRTIRNLDQHTPELSRTLRNLPELASGTCTILHRNLPEPSGTCLRNLHQHTPEPSGTFRNLPPEPAPATRASTHRRLSGLKTPLAYAVGEKKKLKKGMGLTKRVAFARFRNHTGPDRRHQICGSICGLTKKNSTNLGKTPGVQWIRVSQRPRNLPQDVFFFAFKKIVVIINMGPTAISETRAL